MNLGEIKIQALMLMYPDSAIKYDDSSEQGVEAAVYELKSDPNFEGLLESCVGSINRAFSQIEAAGLSLIRCVDKPLSLCTRAADGRVVIEAERDFLCMDKLLCHKDDKTYACGFEVVQGKIYTGCRGDVYTVVFKTKIPRITRTTKESLEIELPTGVCEAIPYFVMSELISGEDAERSKWARAEFEAAIKSQAQNIAPCHSCFQIIYSME